MAKARTELIHCDNCGEDYAATYRRCPFCNAKPGAAPPPDDFREDAYYDEEPARRKGGKRLSGGRPPRRGGDGQIWRTVLYILASLVIVAAIWIMCAKVIPKLLPAPRPSPSQDQAASPSAAPSPSPSLAPSAAPSAEPAETDDPLSLDSPYLPSVEPDPLTSQVPASAAPASALTLSSTDFTLSPRYPTYQMEVSGAGRAQVSYAIQNEAVATVSATGLITAVGNGATTLTVTDQSGSRATCVVRVSGMSGSTAPSSAAPSASPGAGAALSTTDFTLSESLGYTARLTVTGGAAVSWSSSDESVATVSANGTVTGHSKGTARITCTLDTGATLRAIVRVN